MTAREGVASIGGIPLSIISLVTLTVQNSALTIVLHYSRISVPQDKMYSAASAVLLNELLKVGQDDRDDEKSFGTKKRKIEMYSGKNLRAGLNHLRKEVFSSDSWKLSIPACLYVIQNNLQFVAASNLDVPTFQVTYNLKILTTALFSVILLRRQLTRKKWLALMFLAMGVGVVQLQSTAAAGHATDSTSLGPALDKFKGLVAVGAACMTSGLAGVYFEMVLKGSKADLWIRNVQLSFFSLLPALVPVFFPNLSLFSTPANAVPVARQAIFAHFGVWAWAVVLIQVIGGLVTALVIKFSDNILKGFATSLAIVLSFIAGIILFDFQVTASFLCGTLIVVGATYLYNQPDQAAQSKQFLPQRGIRSRESSPMSLNAFNTQLNSPPSPNLTQSAALTSLRNSTGSQSRVRTSSSQQMNGFSLPNSNSSSSEHIVGFMPSADTISTQLSEHTEEDLEGGNSLGMSQNREIFFPMGIAQRRTEDREYETPFTP